MLKKFIADNGLPQTFEQIAREFYIPLAEQLRAKRTADATFFVGINGCQGSGKSTLTAFITAYLHDKYALNIAALSLDDFYLSQAQRNSLAKRVHPLLATRGVPGTHDTAELKRILTALKQGVGRLVLPKFSKINDNPIESRACPEVHFPVDMVLFEGWCWGLEPQTNAALVQPVNQLEAEHDKHGVWRHFVNQQLLLHYAPLYQDMDYWLFLQAPSFEVVYQWRLEQEQHLAHTHPIDRSHQIMSALEIKQFTQYFQRLTQHALATMPTRVDVVLSLDKSRKVILKRL